MSEQRLLALICVLGFFVFACSGTPVDRPTAEGAVVGTLAGTYIAAEVALTQGAGGGASSATPWIAAGAAIGGLAGAAMRDWIAQRSGAPVPSEPATGPYDLLKPRPHQFDLVVENLSGFTAPGSIVRVREFNIEGNGLDFSSLGLNYQQMPTFELRYWFNDVDALDVTGRSRTLMKTETLSAGSRLVPSTE